MTESVLSANGETKHQIHSLLRLSLSLALLFPGGSVAADASHGAQIAAACASCHDPSGRGHAIPPITSLDEQTIIKFMHNYRASESSSHVMHAVALSLSEEEIGAVARHLAANVRHRDPP
ncbi:c-type cytochrome [Sinorhizobium fredii]|uniref:c-type cytochrome n=1 Tax=Rhizobium fredii TaxID=380 RepID=UPI001F2D7621|nr:c-type cytochrome [Sinorhizobium fredii]